MHSPARPLRYRLIDTLQGYYYAINSRAVHCRTIVTMLQTRPLLEQQTTVSKRFAATVDRQYERARPGAAAGLQTGLLHAHHRMVAPKSLCSAQALR